MSQGTSLSGGFETRPYPVGTQGKQTRPCQWMKRGAQEILVLQSCLVALIIKTTEYHKLRYSVVPGSDALTEPVLCVEASFIFCWAGG